MIHFIRFALFALLVTAYASMSTAKEVDSTHQVLEAISEMAKQDDDASEVNKAEEVFSVSFVTDDESAEIVKPGEEPLHLPTPLVAA